MDNIIIKTLHNNFEDISKNQSGVTYWLAREIQPLLEYTQWRNFEDVIEKAKTACTASGQPIEDHFADVSKMVDIGLGSMRSVKKRRLDIADSRALADFLPTVTLKAKEFAAAITDFNVKKKDLSGVQTISHEHVQNNKDVREVLVKSNIKPENLPAEEDIKKLKRRVNSNDKKLLNKEDSLRIVAN